MAYSVANNRSWEMKDSREWRWEEASIWLGGRSSPNLPEARQLINSQLGACFPTKVSIKIKKIVSFSFTYSTVAMREKGKESVWESLLTSSFAPNISKARELKRQAEFKVSLRSQSLEIESLLHPELPTSCYGNTTSATQTLLQWSLDLASAKLLLVLHLASLCCSTPEGSYHTFPAEWTFIQKASYRDKRG